MPDQTYHHGNLREALIQAGLRILDEHGLAGLSLREAARKAGVSHAAPYRHFKNKKELTRAIAMEGFRQLTEALDTARTGAGSEFEQKLYQTGCAYVNFATGNPELIKLMFSQEQSMEGCEGNKPDNSIDAFGRLLGIFQNRFSGSRHREYSPEGLALSAWAFVHGLSHILIEKQIHPDIFKETGVGSYIKMYNTIFIRGLEKE